MYLVTADLHNSARQQDEYRFGLFPWMAKQQKKYDVTGTFILGDLTDAKDRHPAKLVNRLIDGLLKLKPPIYVLKGNHDYSDPNNPYFDFLNRIDGLTFITEPRRIGRILLLPHTSVPWPDLSEFKGVDYVMLHQCVEGAIAESGKRLTGFSTARIEALKPKLVLAGDIHRPQLAGVVRYVGPPYNIRFGENYDPRVILLDERRNKLSNLHFDCPRKWSLRIHDYEDVLNNDQLLEGDQVKIVMELPREYIFEWANHKHLILDACKTKKLQVFGVEMQIENSVKRVRLESKTAEAAKRSPKETFEDFCKRENLARAVQQTGLELLEA